MTVHHTRPEHAVLSPQRWLRLDAAWDVSALPLWDMQASLDDGTPLFARLNYDEALEVAAREGAQLPQPEHLEQLRRVGVQLQPYLGTPVAENAIEHSRRHDGDVWRQLRQLAWDGSRPVAGAGKHWIAGAPAGKSRLMGWDKDGAGPGTAWWQPASVAHNRQHFDDGTTTILVRPALHDTDPAPRPGASWADAVLGPLRTVGGWLTDAIATDGAGDIMASGDQVNATPAPPAPPAGPPPHGWHIAVWEVVESARKAGTWRDAAGYEPQPGDAVILRRSGSDPRTPGQEGHIGRVELVTASSVISIDGNHANQVSRVTRPRSEPVGYVACGSWGPPALARAVSQLGVSESTGHNDGPQIARYFVGATRGGRRTGFIPGWNWCAAFAGWSLFADTP